jgi:hypothetical protein
VAAALLPEPDRSPARAGILTAGGEDPTVYGITVRCPGCSVDHHIRVRPPALGAANDELPPTPWHTADGTFSWNWDAARPTVYGVVSCRRLRFVHPTLGAVIEPGWECSFEIHRGWMRFSAACSHRLRGQRVPVPLRPTGSTHPLT